MAASEAAGELDEKAEGVSDLPHSATIATRRRIPQYTPVEYSLFSGSMFNNAARIME